MALVVDNVLPAHYSDALPPVVRYVVFLVVILAHLLGIWGLLQISAVRDAVAEAVPIFVQWIAPPAAPPLEIPPPPPQPKPRIVKKEPQPIIAAPKVEKAVPAPFVVPEPPSEPVKAELEQPVVIASPASSAQVAPPPPKTIPALAVRYREMPKPVYPALSKRLNEEGRVMIRVLIDAEGKARQWVMAESSGVQRLDEAAVSAVKSALFYPYIEGCVAIPVWVQIPITFSLSR